MLHRDVVSSRGWVCEVEAPEEGLDCLGERGHETVLADPVSLERGGGPSLACFPIDTRRHGQA